MALREIRFIISTGQKEKDYILAREIYQPFTWYMDSLMRRRFKEYSGDQVKGISIVNLRLYTENQIHIMQERSENCFVLSEEWVPMLNTLEFESQIDLAKLNGSRVENILTSLKIFIEHASKSDLPHMKLLVTHIKESIGTKPIESAIEKADNFYANEI